MAEHTWVRAWERFIGGDDHQGRAQAALADEEGAPEQAIFRSDDGTWATLKDLDGVTAWMRTGVERQYRTMLSDEANAALILVGPTLQRDAQALLEAVNDIRMGIVHPLPLEDIRAAANALAATLRASRGVAKCPC